MINKIQKYYVIPTFNDCKFSLLFFYYSECVIIHIIRHIDTFILILIFFIKFNVISSFVILDELSYS